MTHGKASGSGDPTGRLSRRELGQGSAAAGAGAIAALTSGSNDARGAPRKRRYALVGAGSRSYMYQKAVHETFERSSELVAIVDLNPGRAKRAQEFAARHGRPEPKAYAADAFDRMIAETRPDVVIVTTPCGTHEPYIVRAMELGADVITEKAMATEAAQCQRIVDTRRKTGRKCTVAFNYRYTPVRSQLKELLISGLIGDVLSVDFHWMLDTRHGADYFRRWHSLKRFSGGLMVHKATHHFDLVNWWLSAIPVSVRASGRREFYTPKMAKRLGLASHHERCHTCPEKNRCGFELSLAQNPELKSLYLDHEQHDGYFRDRCVFRPEIEIEDSMNVVVTYDTGATLSYSLNAFCAWEGYVVAFNGTKGRIEHRVEEKISLAGDGGVPGAIAGDGTYLRVYPLRKPAYQIEPRKGSGGHGGGDALMLADLFGRPRAPDKLLRAADERSGTYSVLVGVAANQGFLTTGNVRIADLIRNLGAPSYPPMPSRNAPVPMPVKG